MPPAGILTKADDRLRSALDGVRGLGAQGSRIDRVRVAAAVQQEVLVLQVGERLRVERHADEVEVRVEAVHLQRVLDVVGRGAVAVVVGVLLRAVVGCTGVDGRQRVGAQDVAVQRARRRW